MSADLEKLDLECVPPQISGGNFQSPARSVNEPVQEFDDSADIRDYLEIIIRRKWQILTVLIVSVVTTLIISLTLSPLYKAAGKIELTIQSPRVTKFEDMAILGAQVQTREFMQTHLKLLKSESLADRVIDKLNLENNPAFNPPKGQKARIINILSSLNNQLMGFFGSMISRTEQSADPKMLQARLRRGLEAKFDKNLDVQPERDTTIFSLAFVSADATLSRNVINALIEEFISWQVDKKLTRA